MEKQVDHKPPLLPGEDFDDWKRCWDEFIECQRAASNRSGVRGMSCQMIFPTPPSSNIPAALHCLEESEILFDDDLARCTEEYRACRGLPVEVISEQVKTDQVKKGLARGSNAAWGASCIMGMFAAATGGIQLANFLFLKIPLGAAGLGATTMFLFLGAVFGKLAVDISNVAIDPIDPDFANPAIPRFPKPPVIMPKGTISGIAATALNAVLANSAEGIGLGAALVASINKAQGAEVAGKRKLRERRLADARLFAKRWAYVLSQAAALRADAVGKLKSGGFPDRSISAKIALQLRRKIVKSGWPKSLRDTLARCGIKGRRREQVLRRLTGALLMSPIRRVRLIETLRSATMDSHEKRVARFLRRFAAS